MNITLTGRENLNIETILMILQAKMNIKKPIIRRINQIDTITIKTLLLRNIKTESAINAGK